MLPLSDLPTAALYYAELGYPVFPCVLGAKLPLTKNGFKDASTNLDQVEAWWIEHPTANVAIATEGLLLLDIDGAENPWLVGDPRLADLSSGPVSRTPKGGFHHLFKQPVGRSWRSTAGKLAPKVDTRANGGYFLAAPSTVNGKPYTWQPTFELTDPPAKLPEPPAWLTECLDRIHEEKSILPAQSANPIPLSQRNASLARLGGTMRRVGMSVFEIYAALEQVNKDRCKPPLELREVEQIANSIARYEPDQVSVALVEDHFSQDRESSGNIAKYVSPVVEVPSTSILTPEELLALDTRNDPHTLLGRRWLCRAGSCLVVGQTGIGKSSFSTQAAVTWALGEPLFGIEPVQPLRSLVIQAENDSGDLAEMFQGVADGMNCRDCIQQLNGNLVFVTDTSKGGEAFHPWVRTLILKYKPDLVWVDPLFAFLGGNASEQETVSKFLRNGLGTIAQETGIAWMIVHHANKPPKDPKSRSAFVSGDYAYLGSGSAELANWARAVLTLREIENETYELRASKRGRRAGLLDSQDQPATEIFLRHGDTGICWERASKPEDERTQSESTDADEVISKMELNKNYTVLEVRKLAESVLGVQRHSIVSKGRRANRIFNMVLEQTKNSLMPLSHCRKVSQERL